MSKVNVGFAEVLSFDKMSEKKDEKPVKKAEAPVVEKPVEVITTVAVKPAKTKAVGVVDDKPITVAVVESPKKDDKPVEAAAESAVKSTTSAGFEDDGDFGYSDAMRNRENKASFRDRKGEIELKPIDYTRVRYREGSNLVSRRFEETRSLQTPAEPQVFNHVIIDGRLYILDQHSIISLTETLWLGDKSIGYLNEDYSNIPANILYMENSGVNAGYLSVEGENQLKNSTVRVDYNASLKNSYSIDTRFNSKNSINVTDSTIKKSMFDGERINLRDLVIKDYNISVKGNILLADFRYYRAKGVRVHGDGIKDIEISQGGRLHNETFVSYHVGRTGDKAEISIISNRRIDNGMFLGNGPIPFIRTDNGVLVGNTVFTYEEMKKFMAKEGKELLPPEPQQEGFRPLALQYPHLYQQPEPDNSGELLASLERLVRGDHGFPFLARPTSNKEYTVVDKDLPITNGQILTLATQIYSRLRLLKELSAVL